MSEENLNIANADIKALGRIANQLRMDSLEMIFRRQAGHPGGSLSAAEIVATLFFHTMRIDPINPHWEDRDHASALLYAALAHKGYFPLADLKEWGQLECHLQGHPDIQKTPGVDMTSGILGHGIAIGAGLALGAKQLNKDYRIYTLLGDGEIQGGIVWEGAMLAAKYHCGNLTVILDYNDVQLDGFVHDIMPMEPMVEKWAAFNWNVIEIDGHDIQAILRAFENAKSIEDRPTIIVAHTIKGKGVSFMENDSRWHGKAPSKEQFELAIEEIGRKM